LSDALTATVYLVSYAAEQSVRFAPPLLPGSCGSAAIYLVTSELQKAAPSPALMASSAVLLISVVAILAERPAGRAPALSAAYCWIALRRAWTSELLLVLFAWANWRAGLMAISTMARRIARIPMTTRSSINVKPFCDFNDWAVVIFLKLFFT